MGSILSATGLVEKLGRFFAPEAEKEEDGRDMWPSRASFVLAAMGGAVGLGNLLRYPSQAFAHYGLQWFIPYLLALLLLGLPALALEISLGQAYRAGCVVAYHHLDPRTKGVGLAVIFAGYVIVSYYVPILAWVMTYFRHSFRSPLPWTGRGREFYLADVVANVAPVAGSGVYLTYPGTAIVGETVGWCLFTWALVWLCMWKGVGLTGRVVYITMSLPIIMTVILIGGSATLPNSSEGIRMYMGQWHSEKLATGDIWLSAVGQIFFSIGIGMGYFTSYASYNSRFSNAVQDTLIIAFSNSLIEVCAAFAVFSVVGYLGLRPEAGVVLGTFEVAFVTYPEAIAAMPGANFWAVLFFSTLVLLGVSSAFAMLESVVTMVCDSSWGTKIPRWAVCTVAVVVSFLFSLLYCTQFGFYLLDAIDKWINNLSLVFVVFSEMVSATMIYRITDVIDQVGLVSWIIFNLGYLGSMIFGLVVAHTVTAGAGAGFGFGLFFLCTGAALVLAKTPTIAAPCFWGRSPALSKLWMLAFYSGNQLTRDLNVVIAVGKAWAIPIYWAPVMRFISAPILAIICAFNYPQFHELHNDPLHIFGFANAHIAMILVVVGLVVPRWFNIIVPPARKIDHGPTPMPGVTSDPIIVVGAVAPMDHSPGNAEGGLERGVSTERKST